MKKSYLFGLLFFGLFICSISMIGLISSGGETVAMYEHRPSTRFFSTNTPEVANFNGPAKTDIFSTVSMSNELDGGFKIAVNFFTKTPSQTLVIESAGLISSELSLAQTYNEAFLFKEDKSEFFIASKWLFKALPQEKFPPSVDSLSVTVNYILNDELHSVDFILDRYEIGVPTH